MESEKRTAIFFPNEMPFQCNVHPTVVNSYPFARKLFLREAGYKSKSLALLWRSDGQHRCLIAE